MIKRDPINPPSNRLEDALAPGNSPSKKKRIQAQLTEGNPSNWELAGRTFRLAWPSVGEQMLNMAVGIANVFFVGHLSAEAARRLGYTSAEALATVAISNFMLWMVMVMYMSLSIATTALVARNIGAKDYKQASNVARQTLLLAVLVGLGSTVLIWLFADALMWAYGADAKLVQLGGDFLRTVSLSCVFTSVLFVANACLRANGDTRTPLIYIGVTNIINVIISGCLVHGVFGIPAMGLQGAAIGMTIGWTIGGILATIRMLGVFGRSSKPTKNGIPKLYIREKGQKFSFKIEKDVLRSVISIGLPTYGENMIFQIGIFFFGRMLVSLGTVQYAAFNLSVTIDSIAFMPGMAIGIACTVLVGQCLGANRPELAVRYVKTALVLGVGFMAIVGAIFAIFPRFFLTLLINDPAVIEAAVAPMQVAGFLSPIIGFSFIMLGVLRGAGDTRVPMFGRVVSTLGVRLGFAFVAINLLGWGLVGSRLAMVLDAATLSVILIWRFQSGKWRTAFNDPTVEPIVIKPALRVEEIKPETVVTKVAN
jgi:putative MATE family efflux protein